MVQRRAAAKYHFGGKWSNTACSHPGPGQDLKESAQQTLLREMGFTTSLHLVTSFVYRATDPRSNLSEYEYDHILMGSWEREPVPDPDEVDEWAWITPRELQVAIVEEPDSYTPWLAIGMRQLAQLGLPDPLLMPHQTPDTWRPTVPKRR